eukprot:747946-Alexandrium_andersonii.AAC.1
MSLSGMACVRRSALWRTPKATARASSSLMSSLLGSKTTRALSTHPLQEGCTGHSFADDCSGRPAFCEERAEASGGACGLACLARAHGRNRLPLPRAR